MTTENVTAALTALEYIGVEYPALNSAVPVDEISVFVGETSVEVSMHWYFSGDTPTIELARKLVEIDENIPTGSGANKTADIAEGTGEDQNRIDVSVEYPYDPQ